MTAPAPQPTATGKTGNSDNTGKRAWIAPAVVKVQAGGAELIPFIRVS